MTSKDNDKDQFFDPDEDEVTASNAPTSHPPSSDLEITTGDDHMAAKSAAISAPAARGTHPLSSLSRRNLLAVGDDVDSSDTDLSSQKSETSTILTAMSSLETSGAHRYKQVRVKAMQKKCVEFSHLYLIQELSPKNASTSLPAVFALQFSPDGNFLAAGYSDGTLLIWKLIADSVLRALSDETHAQPRRLAAIFGDEPVQTCAGHTDGILDIAWSKNNFFLSAGMDKTVRLWHHSKSECLGVFAHTDWVTTVAFHPRDDRLFASGSLDCRLRLWSIEACGVTAWNELPRDNHVTAVAFSGSGRYVLAGSASGVCLVFETAGFKYHTQLNVHSRRGKNAAGHKITGINSKPGTAGNSDEVVLVSTNDSRLRAYTLRDKSLLCKYKGGLVNQTSQIRASYSDDGEWIVSGSEDNRVYVWSVEGRHSKKSLFGRRDHNSAVEYYNAHAVPTTVAVFAPTAVRTRLQSALLRPVPVDEQHSFADGQIIVSADMSGKIKVLENNRHLDDWLAGSVRD